MSTIARFTIADFDRLIATGFFADPNRRRVELIHGELREMNPIGPNHEYLVDLLARWSISNTEDADVHIRIQNSVGLAELESVPEPDVAWVRKKVYRKGRPQRREVLLIIEVAHSSLEYDRGEKADLYASAGIPDYWVVNVEDQCLEVYRKPSKKGYREKTTYSISDSVAPLSLPHVKLSVRALFE